MMLEGIQIPKFKSKTNQLYGGLLGRQLDFSEQIAQMFRDPTFMAQSYRDSLDKDIQGDSTGALQSFLTYDPAAVGAYDRARKNKRNEQYGDFLSQILGGEGMLASLKGGAAAFGPEVLSILPLLQQGSMPGQSQGGGLFSDLLGVAGGAAGLGWSPFG